MKLNYFGYSIQDEKNTKKHLMDIRPFLDAFCDLTDVSFKNKFSHNSEQVFLLKMRRNLYLFLITRNNSK
jgi:hypothetical protein